MFMGVAVLRGTSTASTSTGSSMSSLDRALIKACRVWMHRFRAPLAHVGLIDPDLLKHCMRKAAHWSGRSKNDHATKPGPDVLGMECDEEKAVEGATSENIWTDDEAHGEPLSYVPPIDGVGTFRTVERIDTAKHRTTQGFRRRYLYGFPTDEPPISVIEEILLKQPDTDTTEDNAVPETAADAESFLLTAAMERNQQLEEVIRKYRITEWPMKDRPSQCGRYKVKGDPELEAQIRDASAAQLLDFYLGPKKVTRR